MGFLYRKHPNRFAIDGKDLLLLVQGRSLSVNRGDMSRSAAGRRKSELVQVGLLTDRGQPNLRSPFVQAAAAALGERPDLVALLDSNAGLQVMASLPATDSNFHLNEVAGVAPATWRRVLARLERAAIVRHLETGIELNPSLRGVVQLTRMYRLLFETPPIGLDGLGWIPFFQRGVECFWRIPDDVFPHSLTPVGPGGGAGPFDSLFTAYWIGYYGPRILDEWDHLLVPLAAEMVHVGGAGGGILRSPPRRMIHAAAESLDLALVLNDAFMARADYYQVGPAIDQIAAEVIGS